MAYKDEYEWKIYMPGIIIEGWYSKKSWKRSRLYYSRIKTELYFQSQCLTCFTKTFTHSLGKLFQTCV